jgi:nucleobase:cation symporter-1, NCS1 family
LLRHGRYNVKDIFDLNGQYGKVNWIACMAFLVSILAEIPFINTSFYVGPIANAFEGADIAWIVGLVVSAVLYYFSMKKKLNIEKQVEKPQGNTEELSR